MYFINPLTLTNKAVTREALLKMAEKIELGWVPKGSKPKVATAGCRKRLNVAGRMAPWVGRHETLSNLTTGKIDIWFSGVDRPVPEIKEFEVLLSPEEAARAQRFRFLRDRNRYIVQHGVLRLLLAGYAGCGPGQVEIRTGVNGKPYLAGQKDSGGIHFSTSHSDEAAAFAFSRIGSTGVDIEKIRDIPDMMEIVERHFTPREKHEIFSWPEDQRLILFYRFWTRKEAVLKAQGDGLLKALDSVDVAAGEGTGHWKVRVAGEPVIEEYSVADIEGPAGFAASVAFAGREVEISVRHYMINEI